MIRSMVPEIEVIAKNEGLISIFLDMGQFKERI